MFTLMKFLFSNNLEEHLIHQLHVLDVTNESGLKLKLLKCSFAQAKIKLLGYVVDKRGIAVHRS